VILYLDASALVKRYVKERGSQDVIALTAAAGAVATSLVSRAEVAAALARAVRLGVLDDDGGRRAQRRFSRDWPDLVRIPVNEALVSRAEKVTWQDSVGQDVVFATFDRQLWDAASRAGVQAWPEKLTTSRAHP